MNTLATRRVHLLARLAFVWVALIVARLFELQVIQHGEYKKLAAQQQGDGAVIPGDTRGEQRVRGQHRGRQRQFA